MAKNDLKEENAVTSCLENKRLVIKFYPRVTGFIKDPKHIAYGGMLDTAVKVLTVPLQRNGDYKNVLTNDEKTYLEDMMGLGKDGLSVYRKENNYWDTVRVGLTKGENFFDLSSPEDYIKSRVALANDNIVAQSIDNINDKASYCFYAVKEGDQDKAMHRTFTAKQESFKLYGKYEDDAEVLKYVMKILTGSRVAKNTELETIRAWIGKVMDEKSKEFNLIVGDKQLRTKMLIDKGVQVGAIRIVQGEYFTAEGKPLADSGKPASLQVAANYLDTPINQPERLKIETRIKVAE